MEREIDDFKILRHFHDGGWNICCNFGVYVDCLYLGNLSHIPTGIYYSIFMYYIFIYLLNNTVLDLSFCELYQINAW